MSSVLGSSRPWLRAAALGLALSAAVACRQDMHDAPRYDPLEPSTFLPNGASAQPLVDGTVARGHLNDDELLMTGRSGGQTSAVLPFPVTRADLDRGEERFNIYCSPCHGRRGQGDGVVVQRGYRQAASFHIDRLRTVPIGYFFETMTNGFGTMPDYRAQIGVEDRWRIAAFVRALQLSQRATAADVPADEMNRLNTETAAPAPGAGGPQ